MPSQGANAAEMNLFGKIGSIKDNQGQFPGSLLVNQLRVEFQA